jgi:hypothetical protein
MGLPEHIPLPDTGRVDQMPSLPEWLQRPIDALANEVQSDSTGRYRRMWVVPASMILDSLKRTIVATYISDLERMLDLRQPFTFRGQTLTNEHAIGAIIAKLLVKRSTLDAVSAEALTEDYLDAIEDLPAWSVVAALRKWNRSQSPMLDGRYHNFQYRPEPPILHRLVQIELAPIRARILELRRVLSAVPRVDFSEEHCEKMHELLSGLANLLRSM